MKPIEAHPNIPLYYTVRERIREWIKTNRFEPGARLPSEIELCASYGVSRTTIRRALQDLVATGTICRYAGKGTFVAPPKIECEFVQVFFPEELSDEHEFLQVEKKPPSYEVAEALNLPDGGLVHFLERIRFFSDEPIAIERSSFPQEVCPGFENRRLKGKLYTFLGDHAGIRFDKAETFVEPIIMCEYEARLLKTEKGTPALRLIRINYANGKPIVFTSSTIRGDRCRLLVKS